jgi:hypothetical protein
MDIDRNQYSKKKKKNEGARKQKSSFELLLFSCSLSLSF